ncbi:hypothetical protein TIFTF001_042858 [Ficus carica]|uniref:Uncharacterized protein n=1 Tax=Ficus carica TaxID=3494 RepID=A0AA88CJZ8_FICCA|nr:hypothetical protein TIFTF001_042858 [Ficus carica]
MTAIIVSRPSTTEESLSPCSHRRTTVTTKNGGEGSRGLRGCCSDASDLRIAAMRSQVIDLRAQGGWGSASFDCSVASEVHDRRGTTLRSLQQPTRT